MGLATAPAPDATAIEYGGFRFPNGAKTLEFVARPVKDASQRTIIYTAFRVSVEAVLDGGGVLNGTDALVQTAIARLHEPGQAFIYNGRGVGPVTVNLRGFDDCLWGPFTEVTELEPYNGASTKIKWTITFNLPTCADARYRGPMEFNYQTSVSIDRYGLTTRTYSGFIRIANGRNGPGDRRVFDSADTWRNKVNPPLLAGFRRTPGEFSLSADKCRLDFSITDEELPGENVPPGAVIEAEAEHNYSTAQAGRIFEWLGSLSATYVAPKGNPVSVPSAVAAFRALALDRLDQLFKLQARGGGGLIGGTLAALSGVKFRPNIVPVSFTVSDPTIYGNKQVRIEMKYRVAGAPLALILNAGGLWRPAPGPDPKAWLTSISANIGPYGDAGLPLYFRGEEQIVDLCARIPADPPKRIMDTELTTKRPKIAELRGGPVGNLFPPPPAERSWITYMASVRVEVDSGTVIGQTLPDSSIAELSSAPPWNAANGLPTSAGDLFSPGQVRQSRGAGTVFAHRRTSPTAYIFLTGYAVRAGYQVAPPSLVSAGGVPLVLCNRPGHEFIEQSVVGQGGTDGSIPIYGCAWSQRYVAVGDRLPVGPMPVPPNPLVA